MAQNGQRKNFLRIYGILLAKSHSYIIFKTTNNNGFGTEYIDCSWKILVRCMQITQWLYAEDLLPKEGGDGK